MSTKNFFRGMNMARWIIVVGLLGSIGLGANGWRLHTQRAELDEALRKGGEVETRAGNIQFLGKLYSKLAADAERAGLVGQEKPDSYFRTQARHSSVQLGGVDVDPATPQEVYKGTLDQRYTIKPQVDKGYPRDRIGNFMYLIEQQSGRVRVTRVRMDPAQRMSPWAIGDDLWKWEIEATSREKAPPKATP